MAKKKKRGKREASTPLANTLRTPPSMTSIRIGKKAFEILNQLPDLEKRYTIAKHFNLDKGTIRDHLKSLAKKGLVKKLKFGWEITSSGKKYLKHGGGVALTRRVVPSPCKTPPIKPPPLDPPHCVKDTLSKFTNRERIRGHGFQITLSLPKYLQGWEEKEQLLAKAKLEARPLSKTHYTMEFRGCTVWLCKNSIVTYFPKGRSYFSTTAEESRDRATRDYFDLIHDLQDRLGYNKNSFLVNGQWKMKIDKNHFALVNNELAERANREKLHYKAIDSEGICWLHTDKSFKIDEMETTNRKTAVEDMDRVVDPLMSGYEDYNIKFSNVMNQYRKNDKLPKDAKLPLMPLDMLKNFQAQMSLAKENSENVKEATGIIKENSAGMALLTKFMATLLNKGENNNQQEQGKAIERPSGRDYIG